MDSDADCCKHLNEITDESGGAIVCTDCGLVLSNFFTSFTSNSKYPQYEVNFQSSYILEILSRLQMPDFFQNVILKNLEKLGFKFRRNENAIAFTIYKTLNDLECGVSIKDISAVTGFTDSQIYNFQSCNESIILDPLIQLEKYCILLELPKIYHSVIKETIKIPTTGHNPITVLGAAIYIHCKTQNFDISMQKISTTLNISCISIQRYIKLTKNES